MSNQPHVVSKRLINHPDISCLLKDWMTQDARSRLALVNLLELVTFARERDTNNLFSLIEEQWGPFGFLPSLGSTVINALKCPLVNATADFISKKISKRIHPTEDVILSTQQIKIHPSTIEFLPEAASTVLMNFEGGQNEVLLPREEVVAVQSGTNHLYKRARGL